MALSRGAGSRLSDALSLVRHVVHRLGWAHAFLWLCGVVGRRASVHIFVITTHAVDGAVPNPASNLAELEARFLTSEEIVRFASDDRERYSPTFATEALGRGDRCFGIIEQDRLVCYCWYAAGAAPVFEDVEVAVDPPFIYGYNAFTDPAHRGRGLHIFGVSAAAQKLRSEGFTSITAYIEADNVAPLMSARKMGETFVGSVVLFRAFGKFHWLVSPGCDRIGFRVSRRSVPESRATLSRPA
jgi:GNAT superfamily N-acetyltransferase